jgi:hypothetical protein
MAFSDWKTRPLEEPQPAPEPEKPSVWRKWRRRVVVMLLVLLVVVAGGLYSTYQATQQAPDFYTSIVEKPVAASSGPPVRAVAEKQIDEAKSAARKKESWRFEFTQDQINEFLARDLPEQFPGVLPASFKDPRIKIENGKMLLGCQYDSERFKAVIWVESEAVVGQDGKSIKLIPKSAGAGMLPMPVSRLFERLNTLNTQTRGIELAIEGEPPDAIVIRPQPGTIPPEHEDYYIDAIRLEEAKLSLEGSWEPVDEQE